MNRKFLIIILALLALFTCSCEQFHRMVVQQIGADFEVEIGHAVVVVHDVLKNLISTVFIVIESSVYKLDLHYFFVDEIADFALESLEIDALGLDNIDRRMLEAIIKFYGGGPVGIDTLAATIGEEAITIEDVYEPYLMQIGFLSRTPRGRCVTKLAYDHLGIPFNPAQGASAQVFGQKMMDLGN